MIFSRAKEENEDEAFPMQLFSMIRAKGLIFGSHEPSFWFTAGYVLLGLALILRLLWYPVVVSDYTYFVMPWFNELQSHAGLTAFGQPFADYAPLYLYLLKLLTAFPISSLYSEKTLSLLFDIAIAFIGYAILRRVSGWQKRKDVLFIAAVALFVLPTVMINSSLWGQSDAIYSAGVIASLFYILIGAPLGAAIAFGVAISVKVQAIFFVPILIGYLLRKRETWKYLTIPPLIFAASMIPAWIGGGDLRYWLFIYITQAREYPYLSVSAQSIFAFLQPLALSPTVTNLSFWLGILSAALFSAFIVFLMMKSRLTSSLIVLVSLASVLIIPYLLPRMHERYFYLADIFSVLYAFFQPRRFFVPLIIVGTSLLSYMPFLYKQVSFLSWAQVDLRVPALLLLIPISVILYDLWKEIRSGIFLRSSSIV